jgi:hypothetical protein
LRRADDNTGWRLDSSRRNDNTGWSVLGCRADDNATSATGLRADKNVAWRRVDDDSA